MKWKINSSNLGKLEEYRRYLGDIESVSKDLSEPDADLVTIIRFKASQFENVLVDDVALDVEGADLGSQIRWKLDQLNQFVGRSAHFICLIGIHRNQKIEVYRAEQSGTLVEPRGESFGFNPYFLPEGASKTFGEDIPNELNPRYRAIEDLKKNRPWRIEPLLTHWNGKFQKN